MKKAVTALMGIAICLPLFAPGHAGAEEQPIDRVVVTAGRVEENAKTVTQSVTVISSDEIRKNQHQDLGGLLRNYGVQVDSYAPNSALSRTSIRGMRTNLFGSELQGGVLLLVDGRRSGTGLVAMLPMVNIERIEILRGPAAVQYGTSAVGGVVNIITRRGQEQTTGMAELGAGSFESLRTQGEVAGKLKDFDYSLGASLMNSGDYKTGDGKTYDNTSVDRKIAYSANLGYNFMDGHRIGVTALGVDADNMGDPGDIRSPDPVSYTDRYNYSFDAHYEGGAKDYGLGWKTRYFAGRSHYLYSDPASAYVNDNRTDYQGTQGQLSFTKSILTLTGGVDWTKYDLWDTINDDSTYKNTGVFALAKLSFAEDLIIVSGGVRYDDYNFEMPGKDDSLNNTSPSVGLAVNPTRWLTLRTNYGESYIVPETQQFLGFKNLWGPDYIGNPNLDPEKGKSWDAGIDVHYRSLNMVFTYFQTDYKDKIATRTSGVNEQYYNIDGTSKYRGIEAQTSLDIGDFMDWDFALKPYVNITRMLKYDDEDGNRIEHVSKMDVAYGLGFNHPGAGLDVDLRFTYMGRQEITDFDPNTWQQSKDSIGGRTTADLFVTKSFYSSDELGTFSVKAEFRNIFDKDYYTVKDYPQPGRSFWLGLRYDY